MSADQERKTEDGRTEGRKMEDGRDGSGKLKPEVKIGWTRAESESCKVAELSAMGVWQ